MRHFRVWLFFALMALGIVAIRLSHNLQRGLGAIFSGYGMLALIVVTVLLTVIYRNLQRSGGKRDPESDHTPWWY
jgi:hypothetical protein